MHVVLLVERDLQDNRFLKKHCIRKSKDFDSNFRKGQKLVTPTLIFRVLPNDQGHCRLGMAVPKKVGNAVMRNLIKRRIREAFRNTKDIFKTHVDIVVSPRRGIQERQFQDYLSSFEFLAKKTRGISEGRGINE